MTCPKCGVGEMSLPRYSYGNACGCYGAGEHLHERCSTCGYDAVKPCADAGKEGEK